MQDSLAAALTEALQDEYKACATYRAILECFGPVRPFINILSAEERHIQALLPLFERYGIPIPEDHWPSQVVVPNTLAQACAEGVQAEIENGAMYDRLLGLTVDYPDVQRVFRNLQRASQENHLPAFQRRAERLTRQTIYPHSAEHRPARGHPHQGNAQPATPHHAESHHAGHQPSSVTTDLRSTGQRCRQGQGWRSPQGQRHGRGGQSGRHGRSGGC
ncbi:MAG: DUF2202 domain-containing protein [Spirulina sp.]